MLLCMLCQFAELLLDAPKLKATFKSNYLALFSLVTCDQRTEDTKIDKHGEADNRFGESQC